MKCDVPKVRHNPSGPGAAPAFPSVPPTKSGEFAHFLSRTGRHGGVLMAEALSQVPWKGPRRGKHLRAGSPPTDAQDKVRFSHRTLWLHGTLPEAPLWNKKKLRRACVEAVESPRFLWK